MPKGYPKSGFRKPRKIRVGEEKITTSYIAPISEKINNSKPGCTSYAYSVECMGENLWYVMLLCYKGNEIFEKLRVTEPDSKAMALNSLRLMAYNLYFMGSLPEEKKSIEKPAEIVHEGVCNPIA